MKHSNKKKLNLNLSYPSQNKFIFFIFIIFIFFSISRSYSQQTLKDLIKRSEKSVFMVLSYNAKGEIISTGSGFFIDQKGIALSNLHVIKDSKKVKIKTIENQYFDVESILDFNVGLDIVKFKIKNSNSKIFPFLKFAQVKAEKGDEIFAIGNPDGLESTVSNGIISAIRSLTNYGSVYQITAPISPGSSGGALFNMSGEVVGITSFVKQDSDRLNQNLNFAIDINNHIFLSKNLNLPTDQAFVNLSLEDFVAECVEAELAGNYTKVYELANYQISKNTKNWIAYHYRGNANFVFQNYDSAEKDLLNSIKLNNSNVWLAEDHNTLGIIYRKSNNYKLAFENYFKALELNPDFSNALCNLATLLGVASEEEKDSETIEMIEGFYTKSIYLDPYQCSEGYKYFGLKAIDSDEDETAIKMLTAAINTQHDEEYLLDAYYNRGNAYFEVGDFPNAILDFKKCIDINPVDAEAFGLLAYSYIQINQRRNACVALNSVFEIAKNYAVRSHVLVLAKKLFNENCN